MPQDDLNDRPALFIPTYPPPAFAGVDTGLARPVPNGVPYYWCPGIKVMNAYQPGSPLTVQVTVCNWGGGNSQNIAFVEVFWSPALSGATIPDANKRIGFASVVVGTYGAQSTTRDITIENMPADAPPHICLLAKVWHALDMPSKTEISPGVFVEVADPNHDRHWAQHNLVAVQGAGPQRITFLATNPLPEEVLVDLIVQPLAEANLAALAEGEFGAPVNANARLSLAGFEEVGEISGEHSLHHQTTIGAGEERKLRLTLELPEPLQAGTFTAYEVLQVQSDTPMGGLVIVFQADNL